MQEKETIEIVIGYETYLEEKPKFVFSGMERYESESVDFFFAFKHNEKNLLFDQPFYLGFVFLE